MDRIETKTRISQDGWLHLKTPPELAGQEVSVTISTPPNKQNPEKSNPVDYLEQIAATGGLQIDDPVGWQVRERV